jgi:hypothetical protein
VQSCLLLIYHISSGFWCGAATVYYNKAGFLSPSKTPQAPFNGRSLFQPITRPLAFFPIFEASPHTCKTEENPRRSSWLTTAVPMPRPPLLRPRLLQPQKFSCSGLHYAKGEGAAVRRGRQAVVGRLQLFTDADGATPIQELAWLEQAVANGADVAIGSRALASRLPGYAVQAHFYRTILSNLFNSISQQSGLRGIIDTQCGFKLFRQTVAADLFEVSSIDGYGFDLELLYVAQQRGYRIAEIPVNCPSARLKISRHQRWARHATRIGRDPTEYSQGLLLCSVTLEEFSSGHRPWRVKHETGEKSAIRSSKFLVRRSENLELRTSNPRPSRPSRQFSQTRIVVPQPASPHPDDGT